MGGDEVLVRSTRTNPFEWGVGGEEAALCSAVDAQGVLPGEHHGHGGAAGIVKHTAAP